MTRPAIACHVLAVLLLAATVHASTPADGAVYHIRTTDRHLRRLVDEAIRTSPTFRALVDRLVGSNVVVYLRCEPSPSAQVDGRLTFVAAAGGYRYVVVRVRPIGSRPQMTALIAHELRHAVEIADAPGVVDERSLAREYARIGFENRLPAPGQTFDTEAAIQAGVDVLSELLATTATH